MKQKAIGWVLVTAIVLGSVIGYTLAYVNSECEYEVTVVDKAIKRTGSNDVYLIFTETETFENTDDWIAGKINSSDVYGQLRIGGRYRVRVRGWRFQLFSTYRNIIEATPVTVQGN